MKSDFILLKPMHLHCFAHFNDQSIDSNLSIEEYDKKNGTIL